MDRTGNVRTGREHYHQPRPLNPVDRIGLMFMYAVGAGIAYNPLPRGINKPVAFMILGAGLWHASGCSCKCLQEVAEAFFNPSSSGGGSYSIYNTNFITGGEGDSNPQNYHPGQGSRHPPSYTHGSWDDSDNGGSWEPNTLVHGQDYGVDYSEQIDSDNNRSFVCSTMGFTNAPQKKSEGN